MRETDFVLVGWVALILAATFLGGFLARKIKQSSILGYILAGFVVGNIGFRFLPEGKMVGALADIGVALLMFTLGLELSLDRLRRVKNIALWGGVVQILLVIILAIFILPQFGFDFYSSLFIGSAFSLSSTAVVVKIFFDKGEIDTLPGEIMLGWLLVQGLAVLPMMVILPVIATSGANLGLLFLSIFKALVILLMVLFLGKKLAPRFVGWVANFGSRELLLLAIVAFCLLTAFLTSALGLSLALGAFLAGLVIAKTSESHAIFSETRLLRDFFSIIFFVSLGMFLKPMFLFSHLPVLLGGAALLILLKFLIVFSLVLYLGYHGKTAILVGMGLVQVGEFAFVLARLGVSHRLIEEDVYSLILSVALITIFVTPWLINAAPKLYFKLQKVTKKFPKIHDRLFGQIDKFRREDGLDLSDHVIICGHGRVGSWLARALQLLEIPYVVIDYNHQMIMELKKQGVMALYGDPADIDVLNYAQIDKAKVLVMAIPDQATQEIILGNCQTLNPDIKIISRIHQKEALSRLKTLGVTCLIQPEFEAALSIIHRVLQFLGVDKEEVPGKIKRLKIEYGMC